MKERRFQASEPEMMDRPDAAAAEIEKALRSLRGLNRHFGSYRIVENFLPEWIPAGAQLRVLDLATGSADIPRLVASHARQVAAEVKIIAVDFQASTIEAARRLSAEFPEIECVQANVLEFQSAEPFDLVLCSLALHHFSEDDAVRLLRRCHELSRKFVLVSDLRRGWEASAGVRLLTALIYRDAMTRNDARLSAERAFSFEELQQLAQRAGWKNFSAAKFRFARQAIWMDRISA